MQPLLVFAPGPLIKRFFQSQHQPYTKTDKLLQVGKAARRLLTIIRASAGWRFAYPTYSDIKKLIGNGISPHFKPQKPIPTSADCLLFSQIRLSL
ncbi:MAG: hypothetical protein CMI12_01730 [Oceanospirillum sp.]|nr:hypothetical protein [Oceanospirillum sp.]